MLGVLEKNSKTFKYCCFTLRPYLGKNRVNMGHSPKIKLNLFSGNNKRRLKAFKKKFLTKYYHIKVLTVCLQLASLAITSIII